jgi:hypothetical protein
MLAYADTASGMHSARIPGRMQLSTRKHFARMQNTQIGG